MIRCLLTAVTSVQCEDLHGQSLIASIEAVFKIFRTDRDPQNQRTAQAALTQMVNVVMRRLELSICTTGAAIDSQERNGDFSMVTTKSTNGSDTSHVALTHMAPNNSIGTDPNSPSRESVIEEDVNSRSNHIVDEFVGINDVSGHPGTVETY